MAHEKTAILSVYDKTGLLDLAKGLSDANVRILASGGTAKMVREAGFKVEDVLTITHAPEMLGGRVKTLHPAVHGGILARNLDSDEADLEKQGIEKVDFVVCNLYPFKETVSKAAVTIDEAVEEIDIGGVTLLRAAAKNHARVTILSDPTDYAGFLQELKKGDITSETRKRYALKAFEHTADYDVAISDFFRKQYAENVSQLPLRYGANPIKNQSNPLAIEVEFSLKVLGVSQVTITFLASLIFGLFIMGCGASLNWQAAASFNPVSPLGVP